MPRSTNGFCCTTPRALCLCAAAFFVLFGVGWLMLESWPGAQRFDEALLLAAIGGACLVNFGINRTVHCGITGPFFLFAAGVVATVEAGVWDVDLSMVWAVLFIATGVAFFIEWRVTREAEHA